MASRRNFLAKSSALLVLPVISQSESCSEEVKTTASNIVISTWNNPKANGKAASILTENDPITAIEKGINVVESDPNDTSVGFGGMPDRDGNITLDACIMDDQHNAGSVCFLQNFMHPISVARKVMEETPHVIISGAGAAQFAENQGFNKVDLHTEHTKSKWAEWLEKKQYKPVINIENHDTIGMLVKSADGILAGGCSTSGLAFKMQGRVGDSPIIGAGLYVDGEIGAATATGLGEEVLKRLSAFLVVEFMRSGKTPQEACQLAINRIVSKNKKPDFQVGLIAMDKNGNYGAYSIHPGFKYTVTIDMETTVSESLSYVE